MRHKIKGIVLNFIRYSESSVISKMYTDLFGLQSYIINNVRSSKPKYNQAMFQPATQLELIAYHNDHGKLNRVSEIRISQPYRDIPFNIRKSTVAIFLSEILTKTLKEETSNPELFDFISDSFSQYDRLKEHYRNFHIRFLFKYLRFMGLEPTRLDHLLEGAREPGLFAFLDENMISELTAYPYGSPATLTHSQRRDLMELLTDFIARNLGIDNNFRSLKILKDVFE